MKTDKNSLLALGAKLAAGTGYANVTRQQLADAAGVSMGVVNYHFGTMAQFRRDLMRYAVRVKCLPVIAQGLVVRDVHALKAPQDVIDEALRAAAGG